MKKTLAVLAFLLLVQSVLACTTPILRNEFNVPINYYGGGYFIVNGTKYPSEIKMLDYNLTVQNIGSTKLTFTLTPVSSLSNYIYGGTYEIGALQTKNITLPVYIDGSSKEGQIYVSGYCSDSFSIPDGYMNVKIYGRGNTPVQYCGNNDLSCGVYPNCQDIRNMDGCYEGFYRDYYCASNSVQYSQSCISTCCIQHAGSDGYCSNNNCIDPTSTCTNECSFTGDSCMNGKLYSCQQQADGCKDLVLKQACEAGCSGGKCVSNSDIIGKIAFLCGDSACQDGIEPQIISWLRSKGWYVESKSYDQWTTSQLSQFDLMACSDETLGCKPSSNSPAYIAHKTLSKSFIEIADYRSAQAAFKFNYISNPYSTLATSSSLYDTNGDIIMEAFQKTVKVFQESEKITVNQDFYLSSNVIDVADAGSDNGKSAIFKVGKSGNQGRYAYVGLFYKGSLSDLTMDGDQILNRTFFWVYCGDQCLADPNKNFPPVAVLEITPNSIAYVNQIVNYDASKSYDPEGKALTYYWDFGDNINSGWISNPIITHTYSTSGTYTVELKVSDGELHSKPATAALKIKPTIQNAVAFVCADDSCDDDTEQDLILYLRSSGFYVAGKSEGSWTFKDLGDYDLMVCSDALSGCNIHSWSAVYDKHVNDGMGFLEISDYKYLRAANRFGYINWWIGYETASDQIKILSNDDITKGYSGLVKISNKKSQLFGLFQKNIKSGLDLADVENKDASAMFKVLPAENRGRYAFIGWFYKRSTSDLTEAGKTMLLRNVRWVECGKVDGCIQ